MTYEFLCVVWFIILGVLLGGYAVLDGFDLGVGILHPFIPRTDEERRVSMNSIGPLWDGNEVWLVTFGGAMFAMMPNAYATIFSAFYLPFMLLLFSLIFRAVSIEFRGKVHHAFWRRAWDWGFFAGSCGATLLFGVAVGNMILGLPLNDSGDFTGTLLGLLHPYALLVGAMAISLFAMHGSIYLYLKTEGEYQKRMHDSVWRTFAVFATLYAITTIVTLVFVPQATQNFRVNPWVWIVPLLNVLAIANIPRAMFHNAPRYAFASSCCTILAFVFLLFTALFPNAVNGLPSHNSISIFSAASSSLTMKIGLLIVALGMPCVLAYTAVVYWTFRGKVKLDSHSY